MENTCVPEFILWRNQGKSEQDRRYDRIKGVIVMILIVVATFFGILEFKEYRSSVYREILPILGELGPKGLSCPSMKVTKEQALSTMIKLE